MRDWSDPTLPSTTVVRHPFRRLFMKRSTLLQPRASVLVLGTLLATGSCAPAPPAVDLAQVEADVRATSVALVSAEQARDFETATTFFAPDAVVQPANAPQIQGTAAVRALYDQVFTELPVVEMEGTTTAIHVSAAGDMAYEYGVNRLVFDTPDGPFTDMGKYALVWALREGAWKVVLLSFSSDAAPPAM